ncbi:hypothetical protein JCM9279_002509 [Rhodotorula babjevae]
MPPFIDYTSRTTSAKTQRRSMDAASPPTSDAEPSTAASSPPHSSHTTSPTSHDPSPAPADKPSSAALPHSTQERSEPAPEAQREGDDGPSGDVVVGRRASQSSRRTTRSAPAQRMDEDDAAADDHHHQPTTLFAARVPSAAAPARKLSRSKSRSSRPSGEYARATSPTYSHANGYSHGAEPHPPEHPPPGPRKLRRKSHGAYYAAPLSGSASSPPASPVTSYAYAQGHGVGAGRAGPSPRRLPGQVVASPRGSMSRDEHGGREGDKVPAARGEREARREEQQVPLTASAREVEPAGHGGGPALRSPAFGPYVCELEDQDDEVTPQDRHYVARMLANLELQYEFSALSQIGTLSAYGSPFLPFANGPNSRPASAPSPKPASRFFGLLSSSSPKPALRDAQFVGYEWDPSEVARSPLCAYLFERFVHQMPGLRGAKDEYWGEHWQKFIDGFAECDLSSTVERGEITKRRLLSLGIVRLLGTYTSSALPAVPGPAAPARPSAGMMRLLDVLVGGGGSMDQLARTLLGEQGGEGNYNAWVGVLENEAYTKELTYHVLTQPLASSHPLVHALVPQSAFVGLSDALHSIDPHGRLALPALPLSDPRRSSSSSSPSSSPHPTAARDVQTWLRWVVLALSHPASTVRLPSDDALLDRARAALERFLLSSASSAPGKVDAAALRRRVENEDARAEKGAEEWARVGRRAKALRTTWVRYRQALIRGGELDETLKHVKRCSAVKDLPQEYKDAEEWALIYVAQALHYIFVGAATGPEVLNILRSFHELIPYGAIKLGLNLVNPTLAIRAIVQLILGQPAGQLSLFQRIWSHVCNSANKHQRTLIKQFRAKLGRDGLCDTLKAHVAEGYVVRQRTKASAIANQEDIVLTIVHERGTRDEQALVERWHQAFVDAGEDPTQSAEAGSFADLKELLAAYYRFRDREQVLNIALEPNTPRLLHATIAVFYSTIHAVANASKLSDRVGDLQLFLNDLVKVAARMGEPHEFISLARRHHQALYYFVHELAANGGDLLDPILGWAKDGLAFLRDGAKPPSSSSSSPRAGADVDALLARASDKDAAAVKTEARAFARWTALRKAQQDLELRVDLILAARSSSSNGGDAHPPSALDDADLDKTSLWSRFLAFVPLAPGARAAFAAAADRQRRELHRTGPGGDLEWAAWWAERETAGAAGKEGVVVAQREAAREALSPVSSRAAKGPGGGGGGGKGDSRGGGERAPRTSLSRELERRIEAELAVPMPSSEATRCLLDGYVAGLEKTLSKKR